MKSVRLCVVCRLQEKRRAERAEQQRIRAEKDKERQARREVCCLKKLFQNISYFEKKFFFPTQILNLNFEIKVAKFKNPADPEPDWM